jgi:hypothetical protein
MAITVGGNADRGERISAGGPAPANSIVSTAGGLIAGQADAYR